MRHNGDQFYLLLHIMPRKRLSSLFRGGVIQVGRKSDRDVRFQNVMLHVQNWKETYLRLNSKSFNPECRQV